MLTVKPAGDAGATLIDVRSPKCWHAGDWNELTCTRYGQALHVMLNGTRVDSVHDDTVWLGFPRLIAYEPHTEVRFRTLAVAGADAAAFLKRASHAAANRDGWRARQALEGVGARYACGR